MARFALIAVCVTAAFVGASAMSPLDYGVAMLDRAFGSVCWYENLKKFPETNSDGYGGCGSTISQFKDQIFDPNGPMAAHFKKYPDQKASTLANSLAQNGMGGIPSEYNSKCGKYLKSLDDAPPADEGDALNDSNGTGYPFKAFNYCLMKVLREKYGNEAIEAVKNERTHKKKDWRQTLLDRENEFRARHGAKPLKMMKDLNAAAQEWSDDNAARCTMEHSANEDPRRQWQGKGTGESLANAGGPKDPQAAAYLAADGWYEEVKDYPWPAYQGDGTDPQFYKIGHFTQSVWDESEYVGYGYTYNKDCSQSENFVAARYSPAGNLPGAFGSHVKPASG